MNRLDNATRAAIQKAIDANYPALQAIPGFIAAEPGFPLVDGQVVDEPAVIAFVARAEPLHARGAAAAGPVGPYSVYLMQASARMQRARALQIAGSAPTISGVDDSRYTYARLAGNPIDRKFEVSAPMLCHVGPDAGWPVLQEFLQAAHRTLSIAMYDFNADYIAEIVTTSVRQHGLTVVMTWDDTMTAGEKAILERLRRDLTTQFDCWKVRCGIGHRFDSAYHEKVAVRDSAAFWLSSGNWSKRSQPNIDPIAHADERKGMYTKGNREWHIIIDDEPLAREFEKYILYDRDESQREAHEAPPATMELHDWQQFPDLFVPLDALIDPVASQAVAAPIPPATLPTSPQKISVQPVLTPDNYLARIIPFLQQADRSIDIQVPYIRYDEGAENNSGFTELLNLLRELSNQHTIELRIILSAGNADGIRRLIQFGINQSALKTQNRVHNKGVIVDEQAVLISSVNWSADGVLRNRDAGVIIYNRDVAGYYRAAFDDDWDHRAKAHIQPDPPVTIAPAGVAPPEGMVRIAWHDYYDE